MLFDFDGYDHEALQFTLGDVLNCPTRKMGLAFVLAMMLVHGDDVTAGVIDATVRNPAACEIV